MNSYSIYQAHDDYSGGDYWVILKDGQTFMYTRTYEEAMYQVSMKKNQEADKIEKASIGISTGWTCDYIEDTIFTIDVETNKDIIIMAMESEST